MGFYLLPVAVLAFFLGINTIEKNQANMRLPVSSVSQSAVDGQTFVSYRDAVAAYLYAHPTFIGSVTPAMLTAMGQTFSTSFLALSGNAITQVGAGTGRIITCYSNLRPGAISEALKATQNDASLGISNGTTWTSYAQGAISSPNTLATTVPSGDIVSVVQIGG